MATDPTSTKLPLDPKKFDTLLLTNMDNLLDTLNLRITQHRRIMEQLELCKASLKEGRRDESHVLFELITKQFDALYRSQ